MLKNKYLLNIIIGGGAIWSILTNYTPPPYVMINWISGTRGWQEDGTNIWTGSPGPNYNVGIGTLNPLSRFHIVGDFYNQGFEGIKNLGNYNVTWNTLTSLNYTSHGSADTLSALLIFANVNGVTSANYMAIRVTREDGTVIGEAIGGVRGNNNRSGATLVTFDNVDAGTHTYTLEYANLNSVLNYNFFVIEIKR